MSGTKLENEKRLEMLWQGAFYQDSLLQSYRNYHLFVQSILIATSAGIIIGILSIASLLTSFFAYCLLVVLSGLGIYLLRKMHTLIIKRGEDVDFFHNQILLFEKSFPKENQVMSMFKVYQKFNRYSENLNEYFEKFELTDEIRSQLTEKGKGHTRRILDKNLFIGFYIVWIMFHLVSIADLTLRLFNVSF